MKILCFISTLSGGGAERVMSTVASHFASVFEHDVTIVTDTSKPIVYELSDKVKILDLEKNKRYPSGAFSRPRHFLRTIFSINRFYCKEKPNVVLSFQTGMNGMVLMALMLTKAKIICSEHSFFDWKYTRFEEFLRKNFYWRANALTVLTRHDLGLCRSKNMKNVVYMSNPIHLEANYKEERINTILAAGRLDAWEVKGFDLLIQIWSKICYDYPSWKLEIAGTGNDVSLNYLNGLVEKHNCINIEFLGFRMDIKQLLQKTSIFVLTSRHEGSPMVLLEAMRSGCCCVAFDCETGPNEIITDSKTGLLVEAENVDQFAEKLRRVLDDESLRFDFTSKAPNAVAGYSEERVMRRWKILINKVTK